MGRLVGRFGVEKGCDGQIGLFHQAVAAVLVSSPPNTLPLVLLFIVCQQISFIFHNIAWVVVEEVLDEPWCCLP